MLAGMYVVHNGDTCQVRRIICNAPSPATPHPPSLWELQPLDGTALRYLTAPRSVDVPLTPECQACVKPAGHCPGHPETLAASLRVS